MKVSLGTSHRLGVAGVEPEVAAVGADFVDRADPAPAVALLEALPQAELAGNRRQFADLKAQLASLPSWTGSPPTSTGAPGAECEKRTAAAIQQDFLT